MFSLSHSAARRKSGFTLIELLVVIAIIAILAAILFPVFAKAREKARQSSCASNQKQIGLAFMGYIQDYDEKFPLGASVTTVSGTPYVQHWGVDYNATTTGPVVPSIIGSYVKNAQIFACPSGPRPAAGGAMDAYLYNDYLIGKSQAALSGVAQSILAAESTGAVNNPGTAAGANVTYPYASNANGMNFGVGHSTTATSSTGTSANASAGNPASFPSTAAPGTNAAGKIDLDSVKLDDVTRHSDGGNFLYADGHVKWSKVTFTGTGTTGRTVTVYFPARANSSISAAQNTTPPGGAAGQNIGTCTANYEPQPGGNMCGYAGTFHLN